MSTSSWSLVTAVVTGLAAASLLAAPARVDPALAAWSDPTTDPSSTMTSQPPLVVTGRRLGVGLLAAGLVAVGLPAAWWVPGAVLVGAALGGWRLWSARRTGRDRADVQRRVLDLCEQVAGDLGSGQAPGAALARAARAWPVIAPVAEAFRVGADVPTALRAVARRPGAGDLRLLAAAWQVAHRTGQGLAGAVDRVGVELIEARATRRLVQGELASARATARLVAALPLVALAMGSGVGGDPVAFLLTRAAGWACLAGGLGLGLLGLAWIEAIARDVDART